MTNAQSCTGRGLHGALRYRSAGELLPPLSILAEMICGLFLLHFPWSRLHRTLSGVLLYGARTFLTAYSAARPYDQLGSYYLLYNETVKFVNRNAATVAKVFWWQILAYLSMTY